MFLALVSPILLSATLARLLLMDTGSQHCTQAEHRRFKIQDGGYTPSTKTWATDVVINNAGKHVLRIPACIEDGQYLLRPEMLALHGARSTNGAQFYVSGLLLRACSPTLIEASA